MIETITIEEQKVIRHALNINLIETESRLHTLPNSMRHREEYAKDLNNTIDHLKIILIKFSEENFKGQITVP